MCKYCNAMNAVFQQLYGAVDMTQDSAPEPRTEMSVHIQQAMLIAAKQLVEFIEKKQLLCVAPKLKLLALLNRAAAEVR